MTINCSNNNKGIAMLRLFALSTLMVSPSMYLTMKAAAIARHSLYNAVREGGDGSLKDTYHEDMINWVYPV
jgi:hypothetical protein